MSGRNFLNLVSRRGSALNLFPRHSSSFNRNFGAQRTNLTKWYWLLTGSGVAIGYFAIKSFKSSSQVHALTQRRASFIVLMEVCDCLIILFVFLGRIGRKGCEVDGPRFDLQLKIDFYSILQPSTEKRFIKFASVEFDGQIYCKAHFHLLRRV